MSVYIDISILFSYLRSTSNLALSCREFAWRTSSNGFLVKTSKGDLCLENFIFYKLLDYPNLDVWIREEVFAAIKDYRFESLQLLLKQGIDLEAKDKDGDTALTYAAGKGNLDCLRILLDHKAGIEARSNWEETALMIAAEFGRSDCLRLLLDHKADIEATKYKDWTALIIAAQYGRIDCLRILLQHGADIEATDKNGWTALSWAANNSRTDCIKLLLQHGAKVGPYFRKKFPQYFLE